MRPINTPENDPWTVLLMQGAGPGGIEREEAQGQQTLVNSSSLPSECKNREVLEKAGLKFGEPYPGDPLFCPVELPEGWRKQATSHSMHSELLDEKGRKRASIFYKAAHYDRRADMYPNCRYSVNAFYDGCDAQHFRVLVKDGQRIIHDAGEYPRHNPDGICRKLEAQALAWLDEHFPLWKDPSAYWD